MVSGRIVQQEREARQAQKRMEQIINNNEKQLASIKRRPGNTAGTRAIKRRLENQAQGNIDRAKQGLEQLKQPNLSLQQTQQIAQAGTVDSQTLRRQRQSRSNAGTATDTREKAIASSKKITNNTGTGTTTDPYKAQQPDQSLVSSYLKQKQGPVQQATQYTLQLDEKIGGETQPQVITPYGGLDYVYQNNKKIFDEKRYDDLGKAALAGFGNALRYSDAVDRGELPQPKGLEWANYYASRGLRPLYNIPAALTGHETSATLSSTLLDAGINLALTGKTKTHDPVGEFIKKDPFATLVELPGEGLLFAAGSVATKAASTGVKKFSPLLYQSKKIASGDEKPEIVYRGLTWKDKPIIGVQGGKLTKGYDAAKVGESFSKIKSKNLGRDGIEAATGTGIESDLIYSEKTLSELVSRGLIPKIAKDRALQAKVITNLGFKVTSEVGTFGNKPIVGLSTKQSEALFKGVVKGQKAGDIESVHGSTALRPQVPEIIQKKSGDALKLGDIDVHPTGKTPLDKAAKADILIRSTAKDFPLEPGQRISISGIGKGVTTNRAITLSGGTLKEDKKVFEVVLKSDDTTAYGISQGDKILSKRIPSKTVTAKDFPLKLKTADYQLLTNIKQVTAFQSGTKTPLDIFPSSGRTKDIVRAYWNVKAKALFKGGEKGKQLDIEAEKFRALYKNVDFGKASKEKVLLSSITSKKPSSSISLKPSGSKISSTVSSKIGSTTSKTPSIISSKNVKPTIGGASSLIKTNSKKSKPPTSTGKPSNLTGKTSIIGVSGTASLGRTPSIINAPSGKPGRSALSGPPAKTILYTTIRKPAAVPFIKLNNKTKKGIGTKKRSYNFLGSTKVTEVVGFRTTKSDITVGDKKTAKLYEKEKEKNIRKSKSNLRKLRI